VKDIEHSHYLLRVDARVANDEALQIYVVCLSGTVGDLRRQIDAIVTAVRFTSHVKIIRQILRKQLWYCDRKRS
jgi:hypothetical protein